VIASFFNQTTTGVVP